MSLTRGLYLVQDRLHFRKCVAQLWHLKLRRSLIAAWHLKQETPGIASGASVFTYFCSPRITLATIIRLCVLDSAEDTISSQLS